MCVWMSETLALSAWSLDSNALLIVVRVLIMLLPLNALPPPAMAQG